MTNKLAVAINGDGVGLIHAPGLDRQYHFSYPVRDEPVEAVSLSMPTSQMNYPWPRLHPIFAQNMPEGYLGDVVRKYVSKMYDSSDLTMLAVLGAHQVGRLQYYNPDISPPAAPTNDMAIRDILGSSNPELFQELFEKYYLASGLAGVQPKILLDANQNDRASLKTPGFIVKSWGGDYPELAANEYFSLQVARGSGLVTPKFDLSTDGKVFVMERFDSHDGINYTGFEDGCVLFGLAPDEKYDCSYEKLAKRIGQFVSAENRKEDLRQLFISVACSWAVRNGDAHLKNFGVTYDHAEDRVKLAPGYDIVSTTPYLPSDMQALTLEGTKRWTKPEGLARYGQMQCDLKPEEVVTVFRSLIDSLVTQSGAIEEYCDKRPAFQDVGRPMIEVFEASAKALGDFLERKPKMAKEHISSRERD